MMQSNLNREMMTTIHHSDPSVIRTISDQLITFLPRHIGVMTILCIGTDRSTGDALGPITGTLLSKMKPKCLNLQGTLSNPVHALNLESVLHEFHTKQETNFIIAIDASLGRLHSVGHIQTGAGPIFPGAAVKKQLPPVGDAFITGIVNTGGMMEHSVLQSTRLSLVYDMAYTLAKTLFHVDLWLQTYHLNRLKQDTPSLKTPSNYKLG